MHRSWHAVSFTMNLSFLWVLSKVSPLLQTTDRRDSVYAFLGLQVVQHSTALIRADYASTYEDTLINTAISIIQQTESLEILSYCERESSGDLQLSGRLPSWVPEWQASVSTPLLVLNQLLEHHCSRSPHLFIRMPTFPELRVRGVCLDIIKTCFAPEFRFQASTWYTENLEDYLALDERHDSVKNHTFCSRLRLMRILSSPNYSPDIKYKDYHGTLDSSKVEKFLATYDEYVNTRKKGQVVEESQNLRALRYHTYLLHTRQLFVTEVGHLGHVKGPLKGDFIYTLRGFSHLVTLRPCGSNRFTVVGTCEVEGELSDHNDVLDHDNLTTWTHNHLDSFWKDREGEELILV
jgi:hypothetical protein